VAANFHMANWTWS